MPARETYAEQLVIARRELVDFLAREARNPNAGLELPFDLRERSPLAYTTAAVTYSLLRAFGAPRGFDADDFVAFMKTHRDTVAVGVLDLMERLSDKERENP